MRLLQFDLNALRRVDNMFPGVIKVNSKAEARLAVDFANEMLFRGATPPIEAFL